MSKLSNVQKAEVNELTSIWINDLIKFLDSSTYRLALKFWDGDPPLMQDQDHISMCL
jgi:hypothetical protein